MRDFGTLSLNQIPPPRLPDLCGRGGERLLGAEVMEDCRETASPRYNSTHTDAHTHSQLLCQHTSDLQRLEPGRVPALRGVRRSGFLAQAKGYLQQFPLAKGKSVFSTGVHATAGPTFRSSFVLASLSYWSFVCLFLFLFLDFGFV